MDAVVASLHVITLLHVLLNVVSVAVALVCRGTPIMALVGVGFSRLVVNPGMITARVKNES